MPLFQYIANPLSISLDYKIPRVWGELPEVLAETFEETLDIARRVVVRKAKELVPIGPGYVQPPGTLKRSIHSKMQKRGLESSVEIIADAKNRNDSFPYGLSIENGRRSAMSPGGFGNYLVFKHRGNWVRTESVKEAAPRPFLNPAMLFTMNRIDSYFFSALERVYDRAEAKSGN
jgi:hypothetical protein